ncbi:MAG: DUF367 domain-containing protein [Simkania negevensis]|nr:DUF367 domain-containing protein [Simkania negevensis]
MKTIILRHRKENLKKCSLKGLETRSDLIFYTYPTHSLPSITHYILLSLDAPPLTREAKEYGLFLIDATWNYAEVMERSLELPLMRRSLPPSLRTAYPRKQTGCKDPIRGLATVEALYSAHLILGKSGEGLLDHYYWKEQFLEKNQALLRDHTSATFTLPLV